MAADPAADLPVLMAVTGAGTALVITLLGLAVFGTSGTTKRRERRVAAVLRRARPEARFGRAGPSAPNPISNRSSAADSGIPQVDRLIKRLLPQGSLLRLRLQQTGTSITVGRYVLWMVGVGVVTALLLGVLTGLSWLVSLLFGVAVGLRLPHFVVGRKIAGRRNQFIGLFPDAIDLIVRGLKSGLPVAESIRQVGNEMKEPVGSVFRFVVDQMNFGKTIEEALWQAAERVDAAEFRFFVVSLSVQRQTGGNLAETLENLSDILRKRRQTKLKIKALSAEARASAMIIGVLPFVMFGMIRTVNPGYADYLFTDPRGVKMTVVGLVWLVIGFAVMAKMVRFEI